MQTIRRNFGYKLISVIIAIMLYVIANNQLNPRTMNDVYVAPEVDSVPTDLVVRSAPAGFTVTVSGLASSVATFKSEPVKAIVDLSHGHIGTQKLPIHYKLPSGDIDDSGWPVTAEVTLERKARHSWYVDVQFDAEPPPGYTYLDPIATPSQVKVTGLSSDMGRVARVIAVVSKDESAGDINQSVDLVAQDERRQTVDSVEIEPDRAQVHIGLKQAETTRSFYLSAVPAGQGKPAPGFQITGYTFRPEVVILSGTQNALRGISSLSVPVTVDANARAPFTHAAFVTLPPGVSFQNPTDANVQVQVQVSPVSTPTPSSGPVSGLATPPAASPASSIPPSVVAPPAPTTP